MKRTRFLALAAACATVALVMFGFTHIVHGHSEAVSAPVAPVYNPYPAGILPSDLDPEIARVLREINGIETEAIEQWHALPTPTLTGNPPILQNSGVPSVEILGKLMNFDKNISPNENEACASCHMP
jgi:cytochrome c peroxidase